MPPPPDPVYHMSQLQLDFVGDPGARFLERDRAKRRKRKTPYKTPIAERWIMSDEWMEHADSCTDPYCAAIWSPYGQCGYRVPARSEESNAAVWARRRARIEAQRTGDYEKANKFWEPTMRFWPLHRVSKIGARTGKKWFPRKMVPMNPIRPIDDRGGDV